MVLNLTQKDFFSHSRFRAGRNVIIFRANMRSSPHIDNKKKDILILGKSPTQGLELTLTAEKMHLTNFTEINKIFCLSQHYNGTSGYLFVNGTES